MKIQCQRGQSLGTIETANNLKNSIYEGTSVLWAWENKQKHLNSDVVLIWESLPSFTAQVTRMSLGEQRNPYK